jgi:cysteine synthase
VTTKNSEGGVGKGKVVVVFCDTGERYLTTDQFQAEGI